MLIKSRHAAIALLLGGIAGALLAGPRNVAFAEPASADGGCSCTITGGGSGYSCGASNGCIAGLWKCEVECTQIEP